MTTASFMTYSFKVAGHKFIRYFYAESQEEMLEWIGACAYWAEQGNYNPFTSFAGVREVLTLLSPCVPLHALSPPISRRSALRDSDSQTLRRASTRGGS